MRLRRLYFPTLMASAAQYTLATGDAQFHYLANVLRVKAGQAVELFDGKGTVGQGSITEVAKKILRIEVSQYQQFTAPALKLHLMLSISKGDRMDYALQKSTELGVTQVTPLWTSRGEVKLKAERLQKKIAHWQGVITSACEQSYQNFVPTLSEPILLEDTCLLNASSIATTGLSFICDASGEPLSSFAQEQPKNVTFFVGPEGGWTPEEIEYLNTKNVKPLRLGPRILRTETAPVAMLAVAQHMWGDF